MNPVQAAQDIVQNWLESGNQQNRLAGFVRNHLESAQISEGLKMILADRFGTDQQVLTQELAQDFFLFLHNRFLPELSKRPDQLNQLLGNNITPVLQYALNRFFWRFEDDARTKKSNPRAYLHRRLRDTVRQNSDFSVKKNAKGHLIVSLSDRQASSKPETMSLLRETEYGDWLPPASPSRHDDLFKKAYLKKALIHFLHLAEKRQGHPVLVPLNEAGRYLGTHFPWLNIPFPDPDTDPGELATTGNTPEQQADYLASLNSVRALAFQFYQNMDVASQKTFLWRIEEPPVTHAEIARRLHLPGHNHAHRKFRKIIRNLRSFVRNWPGPPVDELEDTVGLAFLEELKKLCEEAQQ